jgi:hypothetical protein
MRPCVDSHFPYMLSPATLFMKIGTSLTTTTFPSTRQVWGYTSYFLHFEKLSFSDRRLGKLATYLQMLKNRTRITHRIQPRTHPETIVTGKF